MSEKSFRSVAEFCPFDLAGHSNRTVRRLHFVGISVVVVLLAAATFKYPRLSFMGDGWMWWQILTGKIQF